MNQREGVFNAICSVLGQTSFDEAVSLTGDQKKQVYEIVANGLHSGEIGLSESGREKYNTEEKLRTKYVPGLVNNWLRKDPALNGGVKYQAKNPGSRAGSGDKVVRELKKLRSTLTDDKMIDKVNVEIDKRMAEIQAEKAKSIEIDISVLPEHLQELVQS
ncbi:MAG: hypothetical protein ACXABY_18505 [Candidatus Thorarchaeota archaeon]|jgi:hypothetical protein